MNTSLLRAVLICAVCSTAKLHADPNAYPYTPLGFRVGYTETTKLTAADWVGPDGIVYPRLHHVGANLNTSGWTVVQVSDGSFGQPVDGDITEELRQAIWHAGTNHPNGAILRIASGTFRISEPIRMLFDNQVIEGAGRSGSNKTLIDFTLPTKVSLWPKVNGSSSTSWSWAADLSQGAWDTNFQPTAPGKPKIFVTYYNGKVINDSEVVIVGDPVYRWQTSGGSPSDTHYAYYQGAQHQFKTTRLKLYNQDKTQVVHTRTTNWNRGAAAGQISTGCILKDLHSHSSHFNGPGITHVHLQAEVEYVDGTVVTGDIQSFPVHYSMTLPQQIRNRRSTGNLSAWINIIGDEWTERNQSISLASAVQRGATAITLTDKGSLVAGDYIQMRSVVGTGWKNMASNLPQPERHQFFRITGIVGNTLQLDVPLRYDSAPVADTSVKRIHPIRNVGIRNIHFKQMRTPGSEWHWFSFVDTTNAPVVNAHFHEITGENVGRNMFWLTACKNVTISNSDLVWTASPSTAGGSGYFGFQRSFDSLIDKVSVIGHRHGPNVQGGSGIVVRDVWTDGGDTQLHLLYAYDLIWENVRARADSKGTYHSGMHTPWYDNTLHGGGTGDRLVLFNCDLFAGKHGVSLGGRQEGVILAYNRLHSVTKSPLKIYKGSINHIIYGNTLISENPFVPALQFGSHEQGGGATGNPGTHFIRNTIYGSNGQSSGGNPGATQVSTLARSFGNIFQPLDVLAPRPAVHPNFVSGSLFLSQKQNPNGMSPSGTHYHPTNNNGPADAPWSPGTVVAEVNFNPSNQNSNVGNLQRGWLSEDRQVFGSRSGGFRYGWDNSSGITTTTDADWSWSYQGVPELNLPFTTWSDFGAGANRKWSIELPAGEYSVYVALGRPRDTGRGDVYVPYPFQPGAVANINRSLKVNNRTFVDTDWQSPRPHPAQYWIPGFSDVGDTTDAAWITGVTVTNTSNGKGLLTLERTANTSDATKIMFVRIFQASQQVTVPSAPSGLSANAVSTTQINLAWSDNSSNEQGFRIERRTGPSGTWSQVAQLGANTTSWSDTSLAAATQYGYRVRAYNQEGNSAYSNEATATTLSAPPSSGGITINFNNYNLGALHGQGSWTANPAWNVVSDPLRSGRSLRATANVRYQGATRIFTAAELGGTLDVSSSLLAFQFDYRADSGVAGWNVQRFAVGGQYDFAPSFQPRGSSDNHWRYFDGTVDHIAKAANGTNFSFLGKGWVTIDGVIDYATKRYTLFVDGVQQMGGTTDGWLAFKNGSDPSKLDARFYAYVDNVQSVIEVDNVAFELLDSAQSFLTFDGYNLGDVHGQDSWTANAAWKVVANPQGAGRSLRANAGVRYQTASRSFTPGESNGTINTGNSRVAFQFDYNANSGVCGWNLQRYAIGGDYGFAPSFQPRHSTDNIWRYFDGSSDHVARNANGTNMSLLGKGWVTIDGVINYATKRYTLYVDGVQQMGNTSDGWLAFPNGSDPSKLGPRFSAYVDQIAHPIYLDNLLLQALP